MTHEQRQAPFIAEFAVRLANRPPQVLRYDPQRQVSEVHDGRHWIDASTARDMGHGMTRMTKVHQESTDDE